MSDQSNTEPVKCACRRTDPYDCWGLRYSMVSMNEIDDDGGLCQCVCHQVESDDDGY